jgi:hypothetical protein
MQNIEDVALEPGIAELVESEAKEVSGLDLLGLRAPAEAVANRLMNGVTTVTPAIRYFSVRAWLTLRYLKLGGLTCIMREVIYSESPMCYKHVD